MTSMYRKPLEDWAAAEFRSGWQAATREYGCRLKAMWYEWCERGSIHADGYLAACDYYDEHGWPQKDG